MPVLRGVRMMCALVALFAVVSTLSGAEAKSFAKNSPKYRFAQFMFAKMQVKTEPCPPPFQADPKIYWICGTVPNSTNTGDLLEKWYLNYRKAPVKAKEEKPWVPKELKVYSATYSIGADKEAMIWQYTSGTMVMASKKP